MKKYLIFIFLLAFVKSYSELKDVYKSQLKQNDTLTITFQLNDLGELINLDANMASQNEFKQILYGMDWMVDKELYSKRFSNIKELVTIGNIKVYHNKYRTVVDSNIRKVNIRMVEVKNFYLYKGMTIPSKRVIKPFNVWYFREFIRDSIGLTSINGSKYMFKNKTNTIRFTIPEKYFSKGNIAYAYEKGSKKLLEFSDQGNYAYFPLNTSIDYLIIKPTSGLIIHQTVELNKDLIVNDSFNKSSYSFLSETFNSWK
ncbi:hypothetical protein [Saccharicrinis aurantiacus]|uniref:hypothetical protein n=1 Tax=Saccharicrinis aurantiacus TaxID=1849719 RepID=UPI00249208AD|nr:hypothetical protein [Saccharicrinis aurantiacus]